MKPKETLIRTLIGLGIIATGLAYATLTPSDYLIDIREAALTVTLLIVGVGVVIHAWLALIRDMLRRHADRKTLGKTLDRKPRGTGRRRKHDSVNTPVDTR